MALPISFIDFKSYSLRLGVLALPILVTQFCQAGLGVVDAIMAGKVSAVDLAAVAVGSGIWLPLFLLATGILIATTPLIGEAMGQNNQDKIPHITQQSLWTAVVIGVIGFIIVNLMPSFLSIMGVPANIQPIAAQYLHGVSFGFPAMAIYAVLRSYCEALGRPEPVTIISIIALLADIPLNYIFINGLFGMPQMGGAGCGVATAIVLWLSVILLASYTAFTTRKPFASTRFFVGFTAPNQDQITKLLKLGIPIGISIFFEASLFSLGAIIISPLGEIATASHQVALSVTGQLFMIPISVAMALTIMISNLFGEKNLLMLRHVQVTGLIWTILIALSCMLGIWLFRPQLAAAFTDNLEVRAQAIHLLIFALAYQLFDGWQVNVAGILRGMQDTTVPMWVTMFCYWVVALPLGIYLVRFTGVGAQGFWIALITGLVLASILLTLRLRFQQRRLQLQWG